MGIELPQTSLVQSDSVDEVAKEAYLKKFDELNDTLSEYDTLSALGQSEEKLTEEERSLLDNPGEHVQVLLDERLNLIRENYRFHDLISAANEDSDAYQHIQSHLDGGFGSNFNRSEVFPEGMDVVQFGEDVLEKAYKGELEGETIDVNGKEGRLSLVGGSEGGRVVIKVEFEEPIGINALVDASSVEGVVDIMETELNDEVKQRYAGTKVATNAQKQSTNTMFVIGGPYGPTGKFGLYTVYCGEYAPPAPSEISSEEDLEFWRKKAWATQEPASEDFNEEYNPVNKLENTDMDSLATWLTKELDSYADEHSAYCSGYHLENFITDELVPHIAKTIDVSVSDLNISLDYKEHEKYVEFEGTDDGVTKGELRFNGETIFTYESGSDGYNFEISEWKKDNLVHAFGSMLKDQN